MSDVSGKKDDATLFLINFMVGGASAAHLEDCQCPHWACGLILEEICHGNGFYFILCFCWHTVWRCPLSSLVVLHPNQTLCYRSVASLYPMEQLGTALSALSGPLLMTASSVCGVEIWPMCSITSPLRLLTLPSKISLRGFLVTTKYQARNHLFFYHHIRKCF